MGPCAAELAFSVSEFAESGLLEPSTLSLDEALEIETSLPSSFAFDSPSYLRETSAETNLTALANTADQIDHGMSHPTLSAMLATSEAPQLMTAPDSLQPLEQRDLNAARHRKDQPAQESQARETSEKVNKKLAQNREHQKRFNMRQQVHCSAKHMCQAQSSTYLP